MVDERSSLFGDQEKNKPNIYPYRIYRYRRYEMSRFHVYICATILALLMIVIIIASLDTAYELDNLSANSTDENSTEFIDSNLTDTNFLIFMSSGKLPLKDETPSTWMLSLPTAIERNQSIDQGIAALGQRELLEENMKIIPINTPSYKHQKAVSTTANARKLSKRAYVENHATLDYAKRKSFKKSHGRSSIGIGPNLHLEQKDNEMNCSNDIHSKYRTANGVCNNYNHPNTYGVAFTPFRRALNPDYSDGIASPRHSHFLVELPSAREVSISVHRPSYASDPKFTVMLAVFGQFLDHDITATALSQGPDGEAIDCCNENVEQHPECFPVKLGAGDPNFDLYNVTCMNFVRSAPAPTDRFGPREQMNQASAFIDGSVVYGSTDDKIQMLRTKKLGLLRMFSTPDNRTLLPVSTDPSDGCNEQDKNAEGKYCFESGDTRANENLHLTSMHLIWARHHNNIAENLHKLNPHWDDELLFQESRKILGAQLQHITYNEFLPVVLGKNLTNAMGLMPKSHESSDTYDEAVDPSIANVFAACAFRFAHTLIPGLMKATRDEHSPAAIPLHRMLFNPYSLWSEHGLDNALGGAISTPLAKFDQFFTTELTEKLFINPNDDANITMKPKSSPAMCGLDLVSLNIQRGRDHGLPSYHEWRKFCKLSSVDSWRALANAIDKYSFTDLRRIYSHVEDIDIYTGALSEPPLSESLIGPLLTCLVADQFLRLKIGDSFWYERSHGPQIFTPEQLEQIYKTTLASVICRNSDAVNESQRYVMRVIDDSNPVLNCSEIDTFQFDSWKEHFSHVSISDEKTNIRIIN